MSDEATKVCSGLVHPGGVQGLEALPLYSLYCTVNSSVLYVFAVYLLVFSLFTVRVLVNPYWMDSGNK